MVQNFNHAPMVTNAAITSAASDWLSRATADHRLDQGQAQMVMVTDAVTTSAGSASSDWLSATAAATLPGVPGLVLKATISMHSRMKAESQAEKAESSQGPHPTVLTLADVVPSSMLFDLGIVAMPLSADSGALISKSGLTDRVVPSVDVLKARMDFLAATTWQQAFAAHTKAMFRASLAGNAAYTAYMASCHASAAAHHEQRDQGDQARASHSTSGSPAARALTLHTTDADRPQTRLLTAEPLPDASN